MAEITVTDGQRRDVVLAKGTCDGAGAFRIGRIPQRGRLWVDVHRDGYARVASPVDVRWPALMDLPDATTVRGVLRDRAGKPVAGAAVRATLLFVARQPVLADAHADDRGSFTLRDVPLGMVQFAAVVPGEGFAEMRQWVRGEADIVLEPTPAAATTTLHVAIEGLPAEELTSVSPSLSWSAGGATMQFPPPLDPPVFDREARFELQIPDTQCIVRLRAEGFALAPGELVARVGHGPHHLSFTARPLLQCRVRVCGNDGAPVAGVHCTMREAEGASAISAS